MKLDVNKLRFECLMVHDVSKSFINTKLLQQKEKKHFTRIMTFRFNWKRLINYTDMLL